MRPKPLDGDAPEGIWEVLAAQATAAGFQVIRKRRGSENGFCDFGTKTIGVRPDVSDMQAIKTLVHELAHALLHGGESGANRRRQEVEVESTAFIVLSALGLDSGDYSFPYVARWSEGNIDSLKQTADKAISCSREILGNL